MHLKIIENERYQEHLHYKEILSIVGRMSEKIEFTLAQLHTDILIYKKIIANLVPNFSTPQNHS